jgi:hypothetical protein
VEKSEHILQVGGGSRPPLRYVELLGRDGVVVQHELLMIAQ